MMSLHTKKPVILKYSRPIKTGVSHKKIVVGGSDEEWIKGVEYRSLDIGRLKGNEVIEKTIHAYHYWWLFLRLGLDLEQQNATLIMRFEQKHLEIPKKYQPEIVKKIKVKRNKYKGWDLDEVLTKSFDDWWQTHSHLFSDEICRELSGKYEHYDWGRERISNDKKHLTLQIDTSLKLTDILNMVNKKIKEKRKANKGLVFPKQHKYSVSGSIHKDAILNKYNALVLKLENNLSNKEIITHKDGYIRSPYSIKYNYSGNEDYSRPIWGLLNSNENSKTGYSSYGAKDLLVNVCNGYFMKK